MPPRRRAVPVPLDVDALRLALSRGKIVRVGIAPSDQFPEGVTGRVRRIGSEAVDGDEFLFVEVPVGGVKDVLPFAPADLTLSPARSPALRVAASASAALPSTTGSANRLVGTQEQLALRPESEPIPWPIVSTTTDLTARRRTAGEVAALAHAPSDPTSERKTTARRTVPSRSPETEDAAGQEASAQLPQSDHGAKQAAAVRMPRAGVGPIPREPGTAAKGPIPRGKRAPVTITISTVGDESAVWRIEARIGTRTAVKPTVVAPSRVWEIVESLGDPKLTDLVQSLLSEHRRLAQARADSLTAELSALHEQLKSYPAAPA